MSEEFDVDGLVRLGQALAEFDERAAEVIRLHAALDREMEIALSRIVVAPQYLRRLGFGQKIDLIHALEGDLVDGLTAGLGAFNELRNSIGHGEEKRIVDGHQSRLFRTFEAAIPMYGESKLLETQIGNVAAGLFGMLARVGRK